MNDIYIVTTYVVLDDLLKAMNYQDDCRATVSAAEIMTVAVVAAKYFQNHHERTLCIMQRLGDVGRISVSRFNRRLHQVLDDLHDLLEWVLSILPHGEVFIIDSFPVPLCQVVRSKRCTKVRGNAFRGYCAAKKQHYFGFKFHWVCDTAGVPVAFVVLPAAWHDLTPIHELSGMLPTGARLLGDKAYNCDHDENLCYFFASVELIPLHRVNMLPNSPEQLALLRQFRSTIETVHSQLEKMGVQRLHARTTAGIFLKLFASLLALVFNSLV